MALTFPEMEPSPAARAAWAHTNNAAAAAMSFVMAFLLEGDGCAEGDGFQLGSELRDGVGGGDAAADLSPAAYRIPGGALDHGDGDDLDVRGDRGRDSRKHAIEALRRAAGGREREVLEAYCGHEPGEDHVRKLVVMGDGVGAARVAAREVGNDAGVVLEVDARVQLERAPLRSQSSARPVGGVVEPQRGRGARVVGAGEVDGTEGVVGEPLERECRLLPGPIGAGAARPFAVETHTADLEAGMRVDVLGVAQRSSHAGVQSDGVVETPADDAGRFHPVVVVEHVPGRRAALQPGHRQRDAAGVADVRGVRAEAGDGVEAASDAEIDRVLRPQQIVEVDLQVLDVDGAVGGEGYLAEVGGLVAQGAARPDVGFAQDVAEREARGVVGDGRARRIVGMDDGVAVRSEGERRDGDERRALALRGLRLQGDGILLPVVAVGAREAEAVPSERLAERRQLRIDVVARLAARAVLAREHRNGLGGKGRGNEQGNKADPYACHVCSSRRWLRRTAPQSTVRAERDAAPISEASALEQDLHPVRRIFRTFGLPGGVSRSVEGRGDHSVEKYAIAGDARIRGPANPARQIYVDATRAPGTPTSTTSLRPGTPRVDAACESARTTAGAVSGAQSAQTVVPAPDSAAPAAPAARASASSAGSQGRSVARAGWWSRSVIASPSRSSRPAASAATSSAARERLNTASCNETCRGRTARA